jgi:hypothetical protein
VRDHPESDRSKAVEGLKGKVIVFAGAGGIATATARCPYSSAELDDAVLSSGFDGWGRRGQNA